jgi:DNA-binding CsgD family transcriptional regulator
MAKNPRLMNRDSDLPSTQMLQRIRCVPKTYDATVFTEVPNMGLVDLVNRLARTHHVQVRIDQDHSAIGVGKQRLQLELPHLNLRAQYLEKLRLADVVAVALQEADAETALGLVRKRAGGHLDPALCQTFPEYAPELLGMLAEADLWQRFLDAEPEPRAFADRADHALGAFAHFTDLKSGHSTATAQLAEHSASAAGLNTEATQLLRQAALVHDIGRVAVPNAIWDKPGPLSVLERESVRLHAYYTERILFRAPALRALVPLAAASHERCDASGYHRGLPHAMLPLNARLLAAADVYSAMLEPRAHRPALSVEVARLQLLAEVKSGLLDATAVKAVLEAALGGQQPVVRAWPNGLSEREVDVLRPVARGHSNKAIAQQLSISAKTVQHHIAHLYDKLGVHSRVAAALFATEHGLLSS